MDNDELRYWFHAKRYGWGWGMPASWQGWVVLVGWLAIVLSVSPLIATRSMPRFFVFILAMSVALIAICWIKGEPPKWR
jgi:hypothetical protein